MKVNEKTMLFEELTTEEMNELFDIVTGIVQNGIVPPRENKFVSLWMDKYNYTSDQFLMTISTLFPQKSLLSIVFFLKYSYLFT